MAKKIPYLIIPIFIPFGGCDHQCVFCNQVKITGATYLPGEREIVGTVESYLSTWKRGGRKEIAFYGGSFTALPIDVQIDYLEAAYKYVKSGQVDGLRLSTRPDAIDDDTIRLLKKYKVGAVELGVQSMVNKVLKLSGRGHVGKDTVRAVRLLKEAKIKIGIQLMPGLPGDTESTIISTARRVIITRPNFVRIYPTVVIKETPLHTLYNKGEYIPWTLKDMVSVCRKMYEMFQRSSITIIRMGLQPTKELEENIVAGPYHPSFRQLVEGTHKQDI
ncbi:MAG: radical SAM protein [Proteobacteria bacterium]|nr:radical SAM protein [Pseudomonadota bacterium]